MTKGERVKALRTELGSNEKKMTLEEFGKRLGVSKNAISNIENGNRKLTDQMCRSICREFGVSEEWLRDGIGGDDVVFLRKPDDVASEFAKANRLDRTEEALIRQYLELGEQEREIFRKYLKNVLNEMNEVDPATVADLKQREIDAKVAAYRAELEEQAASEKAAASQIGKEA